MKRKIETGVDDVDARCRERLKEDLGLDDEAIDVIMNLRQQVILLQSRLEAMEFMLSAYQVEFDMDWKPAIREYIEASWEDIP